jgi:type VI secretion system protein ImpA
MSELDQILTPLAGSNPCGVDLEYDTRFQALKDLVEAGTEDNPTDWNKVRKQCLELLKECRSIELLVLLMVSLVAAEGFQGLQDGLRLLAKSIEGFWDSIYPELDMEEPEPDRYEIRLNAIAQLGEKPGKLGDKLSYVEKVLRASLSLTNSRIAVCFWPIWESELTATDDPADLNSAMSHIGQMSVEDKQAIAGSVGQSIGHLKSLSDFLMKKTGLAYNGPFDECLLPTLEQIAGVFDQGKQIQAQGEGDSIPNGGSPAMNQSVSAPPPPPPGTISSREDVKEALGKIIDYYKKNEPSSPVPYIAMRTQELVDSDFMDVIRNLSKESEQQFKKVLNI